MIYKAIQGLPQAHAKIKGSKEYPDIVEMYISMKCIMAQFF